MKKFSYSLYLILVIIIFIAVSITTTINSVISYYSLKNSTVKHIKRNSTQIMLSIKDNVQKLIESYEINEYQNIVYNEISRKNIHAIIIEDYNMGKILGETAFITGKIKGQGIILDYIPDDKLQNEYINDLFYKQESTLFSKDRIKIGKITIYVSDEVLQEEFNEIISTNLKSTVFLSLFLIILLFITIRKIILKPVSNIIETISDSDIDGIPLRPIPSYFLIEINELVQNINKMISTVKESRTILKKEQNRLKYLLELSPIAIKIATNNGKNVIFTNNAYAKLLKIDERDTFNTNLKDYYKDKKAYEKVINSLKETKRTYNELIELTIQNETAWVLSSYMNIDFDGEDSIIGWFYDVTSEKMNEKKLYEALQLQTTIFDNSGHMIIRTDINGIIKQVNKEVELLLGYRADELIDKATPSKFHLAEEIHKKRIILEHELKRKITNLFDIFILKTKTRFQHNVEWTYVSKKGHYIPVSLTVSPLRNKSGEIFGYIGIAKDITQNKIFESQSKLASMGEMIGNIAHQWRQPLSAISSIASATRIKSEFDITEKDELSEDMDAILNQVNYLSKTIDDFREFIKDKNKQEEFLLSKVIKRALSILKSTFINHNIEVVLDIKDDIKIIGYENQLIQAFINILNNAKDAIREKIDSHDKRLIFIDFNNNNNKFEINIRDNAGGIKTAIMNKIFEPYFSTKDESIGTGIGLSMTHQIITDYHNATITAKNTSYIYKNEKYVGANFKITFNKKIS